MQPFFDFIFAISDVLNREKEPLDLLDLMFIQKFKNKKNK